MFALYFQKQGMVAIALPFYEESQKNHLNNNQFKYVFQSTMSHNEDVECFLNNKTLGLWHLGSNLINPQRIGGDQHRLAPISWNRTLQVEAGEEVTFLEMQQAWWARDTRRHVRDEHLVLPKQTNKQDGVTGVNQAEG